MKLLKELKIYKMKEIDSSDQDKDNYDLDSDFNDHDYKYDYEDDDYEDDDTKNYQGNIRSVPGAFLVYKRQAEDSTYEELWIYNSGKDIKHEMKIRRAILAGTDISPQTGKSNDNKQTAKIVSLGNVQFLNIFGIPN
jgi:hypothetical protein